MDDRDYAGETRPGPHDAAPDENPEQYIGEEIPDPWDDPMQLDWTTNPGVDPEPV